MGTTTTARIAAGLAAAVLLAACTSADQESAAPPAATSTAGAPAPTQTPAESPPPSAQSPSPSPGTDDLALDASCTMTTAEGVPPVTLHYPSGWDAGGDEVESCAFFAPGNPQIEPNTEPDGVAVQWSVEPVAFARVVQAGPGVRDAQYMTAALDEHRAVRRTATATGAAGLPEGTRTTLWAVDLSRSADDVTLVGTMHDSESIDGDEAVRVLDAMARRLRIGGEDRAGPDVTVARSAGATPFTVTYRGEDGCLELYAGQQQGSRLDAACDLTLSDSLAATILRGDGVEVVAGVTAPDVDVVHLRANTDAQRAAVAVDVGNDLRAFAMALGGTEATVVAETFDGDEIATVEVLPE